jgi:hypothetical protein
MRWRRATAIQTLLATAKLNRTDSLRWLRDLLQKLRTCANRKIASFTIAHAVYPAQNRFHSWLDWTLPMRGAGITLRRRVVIAAKYIAKCPAMGR